MTQLVKDENGLLQLNTYRPGTVEMTPPSTPEIKEHIDNFKELIEKAHRTRRNWSKC